MHQGQLEGQVDYEAWNQALAEHFYGPAIAQRPAYLCVDTESLRRIAPRLGIAPAEAENSFVEAVRSQISSQRPFSQFLRATQRWRRQIRTDPAIPPPFLGLLGALVLAASRMHSDPNLGIGSHNYYHRLGELFDLDLRQLPDQVTRLWDYLNKWLERNDGAFGQPTAHYHGERLRHVVRPVSQCLLRQADREKLPDFFRWAGLPPGEDLDADTLLERLQRWARRTTCTFSDQGRAVLRDDSLARRVALIASHELRLWDGLSIDAQGRRRATIDLRLKVFDRGYRFQCDLYPGAPEGVPDGQYQGESLVLELHRLQGLSWFHPLPPSAVYHAFENGLVLAGETCALAFLPGRVIPMGGKSDLGGWLSCDRVDLGEMYIVLCEEELTTEVETYLQRYAKEGWRRAPGNDGLPPAWVCFLDVQITEIAHQADVPEELDCLIPRVYPGIYLSGGLKLDTAAWLCGGEPEVIIATLEEAAAVVHLDNIEIARLPSGSGVIRLSDLDLESGEHEIRVSTRRRGFELCASTKGRVGHPQEILLGYTFRREGAYYLPISLFPQSADPEILTSEDLVVIEGAKLWGISSETANWRSSEVTLEGGRRRYVILGKRPGEIVEYEVQCEYPYWFMHKQGLLSGQFTVTTPFDPQWVIGIGPKRRKFLRPIGTPAPAEGPVADDERLAAWLRWARKGYRTVGGRERRRRWRTIWETYRALAIALLESQR